MSSVSNYQDMRALEQERSTDEYIAIVGEVYGDGVTLQFAGETAPSQKHYKCNPDITLAGGQRVYVVKIAGTYFVVCRM